jgi:hypothetical protein
MYVPMIEVMMHTPPTSSGSVISRISSAASARISSAIAQCDDVRLEQIGGHAGAVADIVTDVVGNDRGVAGVVLRNAGLDLADEVGTDVCRLGEDAAAEAREDRDERGAEGERGQRLDDDPVVGGVAGGTGEIPEEGADREQAEAGDEHAGYRAGAERHGQPALQRGACGFRSTDVGADRDVHADIAGDARQNRADDEADGGDRAEREEQDDGDNDADDRDGGVLAAEIGLCAFLNGGGDVLHLGIAGRRAQHLLAGDETIDHGDDAAEDGDGDRGHSRISFSC